ncbi:hypothetical protein TGME49_312330 [Toxoplasma gondii ME49]|uniref:Transmembrane protein n=3 Tax=Toxoplasma gondii TaxID=5811 RepID=A0A125YN14_TOXGV|nr:hypothetical protein TGME49_312330 [Toxoplasma gondii ME49]EPT26022.1 hypothetical protein TGME49_312330 [Toxoplasma gondii ME49]ESS35047.1 putative transmembrane protein [Toxoplasma gondii VEG]|eukprot:XP_018635485.1 hypothetical protein TGME49_312330 [Toxoplasma gondii ME49]
MPSPVFLIFPTKCNLRGLMDFHCLPRTRWALPSPGSRRPLSLASQSSYPATGWAPLERSRSSTRATESCQRVGEQGARSRVLRHFHAHRSESVSSSTNCDDSLSSSEAIQRKLGNSAKLQVPIDCPALKESEREGNPTEATGGRQGAASLSPSDVLFFLEVQEECGEQETEVGGEGATKTRYTGEVNKSRLRVRRKPGELWLPTRPEKETQQETQTGRGDTAHRDTRKVIERPCSESTAPSDSSPLFSSPSSLLPSTASPSPLLSPCLSSSSEASSPSSPPWDSSLFLSRPPHSPAPHPSRRPHSPSPHPSPHSPVSPFLSSSLASESPSESAAPAVRSPSGSGRRPMLPSCLLSPVCSSDSSLAASEEALSPREKKKPLQALRSRPPSSSPPSTSCVLSSLLPPPPSLSELLTLGPRLSPIGSVLETDGDTCGVGEGREKQGALPKLDSLPHVEKETPRSGRTLGTRKGRRGNMPELPFADAGVLDHVGGSPSEAPIVPYSEKEERSLGAEKGEDSAQSSACGDDRLSERSRELDLLKKEIETRTRSLQPLSPSFLPFVRLLILLVNEFDRRGAAEAAGTGYRASGDSLGEERTSSTWAEGRREEERRNAERVPLAVSTQGPVSLGLTEAGVARSNAMFSSVLAESNEDACLPLSIRLQILRSLADSSLSFDFHRPCFSDFLAKTLFEFSRVLFPPSVASTSFPSLRPLGTTSHETEEEKDRLLLTSLSSLAKLQLPEHFRLAFLLSFRFLMDRKELENRVRLSQAELCTCAAMCHYAARCRVSCVEALEVLLAPENLSRLSPSTSLSWTLDGLLALVDYEAPVLQLREHLPEFLLEEDFVWREGDNVAGTGAPQAHAGTNFTRFQHAGRDGASWLVALKAFVALSKASDADVALAEQMLHNIGGFVQKHLSKIPTSLLASWEAALRRFMRAKEQQSMKDLHRGLQAVPSETLGVLLKSRAAESEGQRDENGNSKRDREIADISDKGGLEYGQHQAETHRDEGGLDCKSLTELEDSAIRREGEEGRAARGASVDEVPGGLTLSPGKADTVRGVSPSLGSSPSPWSVGPEANEISGRRKKIWNDWRLLGSEASRVRRQEERYRHVLGLHEEVLSQLKTRMQRLRPSARELDDILSVMTEGLPGTYIHSFPHQRHLTASLRRICWNAIKSQDPDKMTTPQLLRVLHVAFLHSVAKDADEMLPFLRQLEADLRPSLLESGNQLLLSQVLYVAAKMEDIPENIKFRFFRSAARLHLTVLRRANSDAQARGDGESHSECDDETDAKDRRTTTTGRTCEPYAVYGQQIELQTIINVATAFLSCSWADPEAWRLLSAFYVEHSHPDFTEMLVESASPSSLSSAVGHIRWHSKAPLLAADALPPSLFFCEQRGWLSPSLGLLASVDKVTADRIRHSWLLRWVRAGILLIANTSRLSGHAHPALIVLVLQVLMDKRPRQPEGETILNMLPHGVLLDALGCFTLLGFHVHHPSAFDSLLEYMTNLGSPLVLVDSLATLTAWTVTDILRREGDEALRWRVSRLASDRGSNPLSQVRLVSRQKLETLFLPFKRSCEASALDVSSKLEELGIAHALWPSEADGLPLAISLQLPSSCQPSLCSSPPFSESSLSLLPHEKEAKVGLVLCPPSLTERRDRHARTGSVQFSDRRPSETLSEYLTRKFNEDEDAFRLTTRFIFFDVGDLPEALRRRGWTRLLFVCLSEWHHRGSQEHKDTIHERQRELLVKLLMLCSDPFRSVHRKSICAEAENSEKKAMASFGSSIPLKILVLSVQAAPARRKQETVVEEVEEETPTTAARGKMATRSIVMGSTSTVAGTLAVVAGYFLGRRADQQEEEAQERRLRYAGRSLTVLGVLAVLFGLASLFRARRCCGRLRRSKKNKKKTR